MSRLEMVDDLIAVIVRCAREIAEREGIKLPGDLGADTALFGQRGIFDSLGLVSLVVTVEETVEDQFGAAIRLASERAMSQASSPFRTIRSLAEYVGQLIGESDAATR